VSLSRRAARRDSNEPDIVRDLRKIGHRVIQHSGKGEPDLFVLDFGGRWIAMEVKKPKTGKLTKAQQKDTRGVNVVKTLDDALYALGFIRQVAQAGGR
jgi:Holliday junction resolvase